MGARIPDDKNSPQSVASRQDLADPSQIQIIGLQCTKEYPQATITLNPAQCCRHCLNVHPNQIVETGALVMAGDIVVVGIEIQGPGGAEHFRSLAGVDALEMTLLLQFTKKGWNPPP